MFSNLLSLLGNINDNDDHMVWCIWIEIEDCQDIYYSVNLDFKYSRVPYFYMILLLWFLYQQWVLCFKKCSTPRKEFGQLHV